jgi:hypothetical protein
MHLLTNASCFHIARLTLLVPPPVPAQLGVDVECSDTGCPPVRINAKGISGGEAEISGQISSQFLSAMLMTSPLADGPVTIKIKDELMSAPYVHMTMKLMRQFGVTVRQTYYVHNRISYSQCASQSSFRLLFFITSWHNPDNPESLHWLFSGYQRGG